MRDVTNADINLVSGLMVSHGISPALKKTLIKVGMGHSKVPRMWCDGEVECLFLSE